MANAFPVAGREGGGGKGKKNRWQAIHHVRPTGLCPVQPQYEEKGGKEKKKKEFPALSASVPGHSLTLDRSGKKLILAQIRITCRCPSKKKKRPFSFFSPSVLPANL